jgi:hypothetical protein
MSNEHLRPEMHEFLAIDGRARLHACWHRIWIPTPWTREAFAALEDRIAAGPSTKPRGIIITGDADTGKSRTMTAFRDANRVADVDADTEFSKHPAIYLRAPSTPSRMALLKSILQELGFPLLYNANEEDLRLHTINMLKKCQVGTVMIDEIGDISHEYLSNKVVEFLRFLKNLINETGRPFVVGGIPAILDLLGSDNQIAGRLDTVIRLLPFRLNKDFVTTVLSFGRLMPLRRPSELRDEALIQHLFTHSQGYMGRLSYYLHDACQVAIDSGEERITMDVLRKIPDRSILAVGRRAA